MLVLTRKWNQSVVIGEDPHPILVTVLRIRKQSVRLGLRADRSIPVNRSEVYERLHGSLPAPGPRSPTCPPLEDVIRYAQSSVGFAEAGADSPDLRLHLKDCPGCRQEFRRKIPVG
ncbi:MAG: hypothetical protein G01um101438_811 [Parcubacteria group bacterium Gr01-1014_38]|nr:MAG: hypothetical protein G01um101438_811 [Parcubacteria group bacterium Gr01-1014_38]